MKCEIVVGDSPPQNLGDCYWFDEDITESELAEEYRELKKFYDRVVLPTKWPPHLREKEVKNMIDDINFTGSFERGELVVDGAGRISIPSTAKKRFGIKEGSRVKCFTGKKDGQWCIMYIKDEDYNEEKTK